MCGAVAILAATAAAAFTNPLDCSTRRLKPSEVTFNVTNGHWTLSVKPPVPVTIAGVEMDVISPFIVRGVGYSPLPPTARTFLEPFDYFTDEFVHIWKRDLPLIRAMGANTIRLWNWMFTADHIPFLDACWNSGVDPIFVLVPFSLTVGDYKDVADFDTRRQVLMDFRAFLLKVHYHPAVLMYLVGNELDKIFPNALDPLFSLVNAMAELRHEVETTLHPLTVPLSASAFIGSKSVQDNYNTTLHIELWSSQVYTQALITPPTRSNKPFLYTEYGSDAFAPTDDGLANASTAQAAQLCRMYTTLQSQISKGQVVGGVIMEWVDEWWKSNFADVRNITCPNARPELHTSCAVDVAAPSSARRDPVLIHEEWLGLFEQRVESLRYLACIRPRPAFCQMAALYSNPALACNPLTPPTSCTWAGEGQAANPMNGTVPLPPGAVVLSDGWVCSIDTTVWSYTPGVVAPLICLFPMALCVFFSLRRRSRAKSASISKRRAAVAAAQAAAAAADDDESAGLVGAGSDAGRGSDTGGGGGTVSPSTTIPRPGSAMRSSGSLSDLEGALRDGAGLGLEDDEHPVPVALTAPEVAALEAEVNVSFRYYSSLDGAFPVCQRRVVHLVRDKLSGFTHEVAVAPTRSALIDLAVRCVYVQYLENYFIYRGVPPEGAPPTRRAMLRELALWSVVSQWAGTINHAPEKVCEVMAFVAARFEPEQPTLEATDAAGAAARAQLLSDFHLGLVEIFRHYVFLVDSSAGTYDDVNADALPWFTTHAAGTAAAEAAAAGVPLAGATLDVEPPTRRLSGGPLDLSLQVDRHGRRTVSERALLPPDALAAGGDETGSAGRPRHSALDYQRVHTAFKSRLAQAYFASRPTFRRAFPQRGGVPTLLFNYQWLIRLVLWLWVVAWWLQPAAIVANLCLADVVGLLGCLDSGLCALAALLHVWICPTGERPRRVVIAVLWTALAVALAGVYVVGALGLNLSGIAADALEQKFPHAGYLALVAVTTTLWELALLCRIPPLASRFPFDIPGRFRRTNHSTRTRRVYFLLVAGIFVVGVAAGFAIGAFKPVVNYTEAWLPWWPTFPQVMCVAGSFCVALAAGYPAARMAARVSGGHTLRAGGRQEANFLLSNTLFWVTWVGLTFIILHTFVVPSVVRVTFDSCRVKEAPLDMNELHAASIAVRIGCSFAVCFLWLSTVLISFVIPFGVFLVLLLAAGVVRGTYLRVGNVRSWEDVRANYLIVRARCLRHVSLVFAARDKQDEYWDAFIHSLHAECLLTSAEKHQYCSHSSGGRVNLDVRPSNSEAERRIINFLWQLESLATGTRGRTIQPSGHRLVRMPGVSVVVPIFKEPVVYNVAELRSRRVGNTSKPRISVLEFLVDTYLDEWKVFAERLRAGHDPAARPEWARNDHTYAQDLVVAFMQPAPGGAELLQPGELVEIRWWASLRGQTLARTVAGLHNIRDAMVRLATWEEGTRLRADEIEEIVSQKLQILVAHQTYNTPDAPPGCSEEIALLFQKCPHWELVYNDDVAFRSCVRIGAAGTPTWIQRVARLKVGEGKPENQMHALAFAVNPVLMTLDMNQYYSFDNGLKVPFLSREFFHTSGVAPPASGLAAAMYRAPRAISQSRGQWPTTPDGAGGDAVVNAVFDHEHCIPYYRLVGYPEYAYTRPVSVVGELMGAAEHCFVTITQRALHWPLRMRAHYGHPDFFDAYWVRTRGGTSKASPLVNLNEDIFAAYELFGRGERTSYVEYLEAQKGREVSFASAFLFEAKLAMGASQQVRSVDLYRLNQRLDIIARLSLAYGTLMSYITNFVMAISIHYYVLCIVLFALSGEVTYHQLGLLDAVIAIPWLLQFGYLLALPQIVELTLEKGVLRGVREFLVSLPVGLVFFVFHLRTKSYYFLQGLLVGKAQYIATGRGFGLDRATLVELLKGYSASHFSMALMLSVCLAAYASFSGDPFLPFMARCFTLILICFSWLCAPVVFNPMPTTVDLKSDFHEALSWLSHTMYFQKNAPGVLRARVREVHERREALVAGAEDVVKRHSPTDGATPQGRSPTSPAGAAAAADLSPPKKGAEGADKAHAVMSEEQQALALMHQNSKLDSLAKCIDGYWDGRDKVSWTAWWFRLSLVDVWDSEDEFSSGVVGNLLLAVQKVWMALESWLPWVLIAFNRFHMESLWYLLLLLLLSLFLFLVDFLIGGDKGHHQHLYRVKATVVLCLPTTVVFFLHGTMTISELIWSLVLYIVACHLAIEAAFGILNIVARVRAPLPDPPERNMPRPGLGAGEAALGNFIERIKYEVKLEQQRMARFLTRMRIPTSLLGLRRFVPYVTLLVLGITNLLTVWFTASLTTILFNSRVYTTWSQVLLRPATAVEAPQAQTAAGDIMRALGAPSGRRRVQIIAPPPAVR